MQAGSLNSDPFVDRAGVDGAAFWKFSGFARFRKATTGMPIRRPRRPWTGTAQDRERQEP